MNKLPISVCMISGAEAHRIGRALESVSDWVSEIVVVLNEDVNDGTDKLVENFTGKVFREPWKGHIAQKNSVAEKAGQSWLLGLDADEVVTTGLSAEIQSMFAGQPEKHAAYSFPRCTQYFGRWIRHGDWYPDRQVRLWRKGSASWGGIDPHDKLIVNGTVGKLRGDLQHHSMESYEQQTSKYLAYADDFARHCLAHNQRIHMMQLLLRPTWRFFRSYVLRLGFLDGWQGYSIAWMTAFYTFLRYSKARAAQTEIRSPR